MLDAWLADDARAAFHESRHLGRPFATAGLTLDPTLFDTRRLDGILRARPPPDLLVVRDGELLAQPAPDSAAAARALLSRGIGVVIRRAERHDATLSGLAHDVACAFARSVHVQLFVTPARTRGFRWHYDQEDVIILQTVGSKTYYFRDNTQIADLDATPRFDAIAAEKSPIFAATLHPRDALFLPRGTWHMGKAHEDALSVSLGMSRPA